jgi:hypothetical protein
MVIQVDPIQENFQLQHFVSWFNCMAMLFGSLRLLLGPDVYSPQKVKAIPVTGCGGPQGCETSRLPHFLDS